MMQLDDGTQDFSYKGIPASVIQENGVGQLFGYMEMLQRQGVDLEQTEVFRASFKKWTRNLGEGVKIN
jgi:hypothetical protein